MTNDPNILSRAQAWINSNLDKEIKTEVQRLIDNDPTELADAFYRDLEFGTGGLRGIMGVGTNRMNKVTVAMATQGLANYLKKEFASLKQIKMAIAYDSRNNSAYFARIAAEVLSSNSIKVFLFKELRPTPILSFAVRQLGCQSGIVITASHNPKEYNGYKVYWNDGGQLVDPHDVNIIAEVQKIKSFEEVNFNAKPELIEMIADNIDQVYLDKVCALSLSPEIIRKNQDINIVYTALHGTGITIVPEALKRFGFKNISNVEEQCIPDGNFPTLKSPNPEEPSALQMAIEKAKSIGAELVMATDPDADRVGIAVRNEKNEFILLNGNQTASILIWYLLKKWKEKGKLKGNEFIVKTIVTTELLKDIAVKVGVESIDVLTGFKFIAEIIRLNEGKKVFIGGGEESYGYLVSDFVRDKDAVISCCMIAEMAAYARENATTLFGILQDIYLEYGMYYEGLLSVTKKGKTGAEEIQQMMVEYRTHPMIQIAGSKVVSIKDYQLQMETIIETNIIKPITLPKSNVLQFFTEDGSKITVRPSGTEPKIKFYFGVMAPLKDRNFYYEVEAGLKKKISDIIISMELE
jgi:phosphoglucomutase